MCSTIGLGAKGSQRVTKDKDIVGFSLLMRFVDNKKKYRISPVLSVNLTTQIYAHQNAQFNSPHYDETTLLTLESVNSAHFWISQNVSIRALAMLCTVSSELLATCSTTSTSAAVWPVVTALAPSCAAGGSRSWSARAQPFLHRASSRDDFCFSMSLKQRR